MLNFRNKKTPKEISLGVVGLLGLEPRTTEPKSAVLPLHHRPMVIVLKIKKLVY